MAGPTSRRRSPYRTTKATDPSGLRATGPDTSIHPRERALVGNGGFTGEPDDSGAVEIGYEIAPKHRNRGFATEAARAMIDYAFTHEEVRAVAAHTLAETNASNSVLRKVGMTFVAEADHPEVGKTWRWRISRAEYHST
jgi:ribosomal-protein-alanine N-acetyltransferase